MSPINPYTLYFTRHHNSTTFSRGEREYLVTLIEAYSAADAIEQFKVQHRGDSPYATNYLDRVVPGYPRHETCGTTMEKRAEPEYDWAQDALWCPKCECLCSLPRNRRTTP